MIEMYFTIQEANLFVFYRIPKELFTNPKYKKLSAEAKILYGLLLDRNGLSIQNAWVDERGYIYIYFSREEAMEMLDISNKKAGELFKELREVDLIEEIRQGLGKANIIFVKKFIAEPQIVDNTKTCKNYTSGSEKNGLQEVKKIHGNNTDNNKTYLSEKEIRQSVCLSRGENPKEFCQPTTDRLIHTPPNQICKFWNQAGGFLLIRLWMSLCSPSSCDGSSDCCGNRSSTEERSTFPQFHLNRYRLLIRVLHSRNVWALGISRTP